MREEVMLVFYLLSTDVRVKKKKEKDAALEECQAVEQCLPRRCHGVASVGVTPVDAPTPARREAFSTSACWVDGYSVSTLLLNGHS